MVVERYIVFLLISLLISIWINNPYYYSTSLYCKLRKKRITWRFNQFKPYIPIVILFLIWIIIVGLPKNWIIERIEKLSVITSTIFLVMGWLWNGVQNRKSVQQTKRIEYLIDTFLKLLGEWNRSRAISHNRKYIEDAEEAMRTTQLYGTREEIEAFIKFHKASIEPLPGEEGVTEEEEEYCRTDLLTLLRRNLRKELTLEDIEDLGLRWWLDKTSIYKDGMRFHGHSNDWKKKSLFKWVAPLQPTSSRKQGPKKD